MAVLRMPAGSVPTEICPPWLRTDRAMTLATALVDYRVGGDLAYREFLVSTTNATLTGGTILKIWVDSPASMAGGRELWGIPKELADFTFAGDHGFTGSVAVGGQSVVSYTFTPWLTLPGRWPLPNTVRQLHNGGERRTKSLFRTKLQLGAGSLNVPADSPVSFLRQGRVLIHSAMRDFTVQFGLRSTAVAAEPAVS